MIRPCHAASMLLLLSLPLLPGCWDDSVGPTPTPPPGTPGEPPMSGPGGGPRSNPVIKEAMVKLAKGPSSLTPTLGKELKETPPPWDAIGPQASEYARLAASIVAEEPTRGDKASWTKYASAYADSAAALDKAAQARDLDAAVAAHAKITGSCMDCHRAHRVMGPGGPGGPPPGGGPPPK